MRDKSRVELSLTPESPDSVCKSVAALIELTPLEVPALADDSEEPEMVLDATAFDHRFADVWQQTTNILPTHFTPARGSDSIIQTAHICRLAAWLSVTHSRYHTCGVDDSVCESDTAHHARSENHRPTAGRMTSHEPVECTGRNFCR